MNTWYIQILIALIPGILISFFTASLTVRLSLKKFRHERWWDRKADLYSDILDSLHQRIKYLENEIDVYCSYCNTDVMKNKRDELYKRDLESLDYIARVRDIGSFIISKEAIEELTTGLDSGLTENDWREMYPPDFYEKELETVKNCLQRIIIIAKKDLEIKGN